MPIVVWQLVFFVFPLLFLLLMSFWLVKNYRMVPGFDSVNWVKMYGKGYFWDGYWRTLADEGLTMKRLIVGVLLLSMVGVASADDHHSTCGALYEQWQEYEKGYGEGSSFHS